MHGDSKCQDERKLFAVYVYIFHHELALYPLDIVRCLYSVKLDDNVVRFNGKHCTNSTIHQPTSGVNVSMEHDTCSNRMASRPAVVSIQFFISSLTFLFPLNSLMYGISLVSAFNLESISVLYSWHNWRVA